jgi:hypothetical protein
MYLALFRPVSYVIREQRHCVDPKPNFTCLTKYHQEFDWKLAEVNVNIWKSSEGS